MSKTMNIEETFKLGRNIDTYFEMWENARIKSDPLIEGLREYIEKNTEKTRIGIVTRQKKESTR